MLYLFTEALLFYIQGVSLAPPISASTQAVLLWLSPRLDEWCYAQTLSVDQRPHLKIAQWRRQEAEPYTAWCSPCVLRLLLSNNFLLPFPLWVCLKCQNKCCRPRSSGRRSGQSCVTPTQSSLQVRVASLTQSPLFPEDSGDCSQLGAALFWVSPGLPAPQKPSQVLEVMTGKTRGDLPVLPLDEATKAVPGMLALSGVFISLK